MTKTEANRANAQLSTGPRTDAGKARSARNARKHGLTARDLVVTEEDRPEFEELKAELISELDPQSLLEQLTFNNLLHAAWTLRRCRRAEAELAAQGPDPLLDDAASKKQDRITRYLARAERGYYKALRELKDLQANLGPHPAEVSVQQATVPNEPIPPLNEVPKLTPAKKREIENDLDRMLREIDQEAALLGRQAMSLSDAEMATLNWKRR